MTMVHESCRLTGLKVVLGLESTCAIGLAEDNYALERTFAARKSLNAALANFG